MTNEPTKKLGPIVQQGSLSEYLHSADAAYQEVQEARADEVRLCGVIDSVLKAAIDHANKDAPVAATLLNMQARLLFTASVRVALAGDPSPLPPILRTALECACYGQAIALDPALGPIWMARHDSEDARKKCRNSFGSSIIDRACVRLAAKIEGDHRIIKAHYDRLIDLGAHPNVAGVMLQMRPRETDTHHIFERSGPDANGGNLCLFLAFETGLFAAMVIADRPPMPADLRGAFSELMEVRGKWEDELREAALAARSSGD